MKIFQFKFITIKIINKIYIFYFWTLFCGIDWEKDNMAYDNVEQIILFYYKMIENGEDEKYLSISHLKF
jgi:hypothetical protein